MTTDRSPERKAIKTYNASSKISNLPGGLLSVSFIDIRVSKPGGIRGLESSYALRNQSSFTLRSSVFDVTNKP